MINTINRKRWMELEEERECREKNLAWLSLLPVCAWA